jgi:hypothetical protein
MSDGNYENDELRISYGIDDPVITGSNAIKVLRILELDRTPRPRIARQRLDGMSNPHLGGSFEFPERSRS